MIIVEQKERGMNKNVQIGGCVCKIAALVGIIHIINLFLLDSSTIFFSAFF